MISKEKIAGLVGISTFACLFYLANRYASIKASSIENNKMETIGKVFRIDNGRGHTHACFYYYHNGKRFEAWKSVKESRDSYINGFYVINLSTQNPNYSDIFLDKEVFDTIAIIDAGFRREQ